jgi:hypothetical protein
MISRKTMLLLFAALLASLTASSEAKSASIYRVTAIQRLTSGAPGAYPNLGLLARIDDGAGRPAPYATGEVSWTLDRRQLAPGAVDDLLAAPAGTQFGWVTTGATGGTAVQLPLHKLGVSNEAGDETIEAAFDIPSEYSSVVGATAPVTIRVRPDQLVVTLNIQSAVGRVRASGIGDLMIDLIGVYFFGTYPSAGSAQHFAAVPTAATTVAMDVAARPCADAACGALGSPATDTLSVSLPNAVTVRTPRRAVYGQATTFSGAAWPGAHVHLAYQRASGAEPACTPTSVDRLPACSPSYADTYDRLVEPTVADASGRWSERVVLRTAFINRSLGLAHPATGRYAAVVYSGDVNGIPSFNGGRFSIFAAPGVETAVALAQPRVTLRRQGSGGMRIKVSVPGGDPFVHVQVDAGNKTLVSGQLDVRGFFRATVPGAGKQLRLRVTASVSGARSSTATVALGRKD